jgi:hypothetical protein
MVDRELRTQLSQDLRWLVTGRITNFDFDDAYSDRYIDSQDRAVVEIAECGHGLYSDTSTYRLKGRYSIDRPTRRSVARCILFLRSNHEYDWPAWPHSTGFLYWLAIIGGNGITAGSAIGICLLLVIANGGVRDIAFAWPFVLFWPLGVIGLASCLFSVWYLWCEGHRHVLKSSPKWRAWLRHGDYEVWPFRWREDFYDARRNFHLLGDSNRNPSAGASAAS